MQSEICKFLFFSLVSFFVGSIVSSPLYGNIIDVFPNNPSVVLQKIQDVPINDRTLTVPVPGGVIPTSLQVEYPMTMSWSLSQGVSIKKLMDHYTGQVVLKSNRKPVSIVSVNKDDVLVTDLKDNKSYFVSLNDLIFQDPIAPQRLLTVHLPILRRPKVDVTLSYMIDTLSTDISYYAFFDEEKSNLSLNGYVYLTNASGQDYDKSKINLHVGGEQFLKNRSRDSNPHQVRSFSAASNQESSTSTDSDDFYIFDIQKIINVDAHSTTSFRFFNEKTIKATKKYRFYAHRAPSGKQKPQVPVDVVLSVKNTTGFPLPSGSINLVKDEQFVGQDLLPSLSKRQDHDIHYGKTNEVLGRRIITEVKDKGNKRKTTVEIVLQNNKIEDTDVEIRELIPFGSKIIDANFEFKKDSATGFSVKTTVPAIKKQTLTYTFEKTIRR